MSIHIARLAGTLLAFAALTACSDLSMDMSDMFGENNDPWQPDSLWEMEDLYGVWSASPSMALAVGDLGRVVWFDGSTWSMRPTGNNQPLWGVWGAAADDIYAVSNSGEILHHDGNSWSTALSSRLPLMGVWGSAGNDIYAVGMGAIIWHYDGSTWTADTTRRQSTRQRSCHPTVASKKSNQPTLNPAM